MKLIAPLVFCSLVALSYVKCRETNKGQYKDLRTGKRIQVVVDTQTGAAIDRHSHRPVAIYVNLKTNDTIHGPTGKVINGLVHTYRN